MIDRVLNSEAAGLHVTITGAAGFIGSHLAEWHLARGDFVHGFDDLSTGSHENVALLSQHPRFRFHRGDICDTPSLQGAINDSSVVYHLAAVVGVFRVIEQPRRTLDVNIEGTRRVLAAAAAAPRPPRVVVASSSEVYGPSQASRLAEDDWLLFRPDRAGRWGYTVSKLTNEADALAWWNEHRLPVVIVRLFNTVGLRQSPRYGMVLPRLSAQAAQGLPMTIFGDGTQTRSFCDVKDTVEAMARLASVDTAVGEIVNVGADREISIRGLADLVVA